MKNASMDIKKIIICDVPLSYHNVTEGFIICTDSRKMNLGRVLNEKWGFHFLLLIQVNPHLIYYTTAATKMLIIVEIKKENYVPLYYVVVL